jgi:hypothetical protein
MPNEPPLPTEPASSDVKKCPFCAEAIRFDAVKCRFCGERIDGTEPRGPATAPSAAKLEARITPRLKRRLVLGAAGLVITALGALLVMRLPETNLWVAMHSDVIWHRQWQDTHRSETTRVRELYADLAKKHDDGGEWAYLAARALGSGAEQKAAFGAAAEKFPKDPWVSFGQANVDDEEYGPGWSADDRLESLKLLGKRPPPLLLARTLESLADAQNSWEDVAKTYADHEEQILGDDELAAAMAKVELRRGDIDGAVAWEKRANTQGDGIRKTVSQMRALGIAAGVIGREASDKPTAALGLSFGGGTKVRITDLSSDQQDQLVIDVLFQPSSSTKIYGHTIKLITKEGAAIAADPFRMDVGVGSPKAVRLRFSLPAGAEVRRLSFDTGLVRTIGERPIILELDLSSAETKTRGQPILPP